MTVYKFKTNKPVTFYTKIKGRTFKNEWIELCSDGSITISKGYAWNGCSPKYRVADLMIGTPDGAIDKRTFKPLTYYASMIHDAIYQFKSEIGISRKEADDIFHSELKYVYFFWAYLYYLVVRGFGWIYGEWLKK